MTKYMLFDKCIITIDHEQIVQDIYNEDKNKHYTRIGSGKSTYICGKKIPDSSEYIMKYDSLEILNKVRNKFDYSQETCGIHTEYYDSGKIKIEYFQNNGVKEGVYREYNHREFLIKEYNYINGKLNGFYKEFNNDGNITLDMNYNENKRHGLCKIYNYYSNCRVCNFDQYNYFDGKKHGEFILENDKCITKGIYDNAALIESITNDKITGIILEKKYKHPQYDENNLLCVETYYESGKLKEKYYETLQNKHGSYISYYESGQKEKEYIYHNSQYIDKCISYYESGRIKTYCVYKFDKSGKYTSKTEMIQYYDDDTENNIIYKQNGKKIESYNSDKILQKFEYNDTPDILIKYSIESHYYQKNKEKHKEILREFALNLLKSLE